MKGITGLDGIDNEVAMGRALKHAEDWFARMLGEPDVVEQEKFQQWLDAAPIHRVAWERTRKLWDGVGAALESPELAEYVSLETESAQEDDQGDPVAQLTQWQFGDNRARHFRSARTGGRHRYLGMAAAAVLAVVAVMGWRIGHGPTEQFVGNGEVRKVVLNDGTRIELDIDARIQVRMGMWKRLVLLEQGRALFDVVHDPDRPFVVDGGDSRITVLGTRFQAARHGGGLDVTLEHGSVALESSGSSERIVLQPGQLARWRPDRVGWMLSSIDVAAQTSWSRGFHVFELTSLGDAVNEINRYSPVSKIRLSDPGLARLRISGSFRMGNAADIAEVLPYTLPVALEQQDKEFILKAQ